MQLLKSWKWWSHWQLWAGGSHLCRSLQASHRLPCTPHSLSPLGRCCRDRWPLGSWASNEAHRFFFSLSTHHLPFQFLFQQHQPCLRHTSGGAARKPLRTASHDHIHAKPCLFISCHDSIAISCLVVVFTFQALWDVLRNSWPVHKFDCWGMGHLQRVSSAPNELLPSNFSLPCRLAFHSSLACMQRALGAALMLKKKAIQADEQ